MKIFAECKVFHKETTNTSGLPAEMRDGKYKCFLIITIIWNRIGTFVFRTDDKHYEAADENCKDFFYHDIEPFNKKS